MSIIEDVQIELIDLLMEKSDSSSELYKGLNRLRNDMKNGIAQYTLSAFIENKLLSEISSEIMKVGWNALDISTGSLVIGKLVMKTAVWVLFDVIFPHPDADEVISNMILTMYVNEISVVLTNQRAVFNSPFFVSDMEDYEILYTMYLSCIYATMDSTMKLAETTGDETALTEAKKDFNTSLPNYNTYIEYCIKEVFSVSENDRIVRQANSDEYITIPSSKVAIIGTTPEELKCDYSIPLTSAGNTMWGIISYGNIYVFENVSSNSLKNSGSIILNADLTINGDVELRGTIENNGYMLSVGGEFINYGVLVMENDKAHTLVNGRYYQSGTSNYLTAGIMEIKGDISGGYYRPTGTHRTILSGSSKQTVDALNGMDRSWFNILEITNTSADGVDFADEVDVKKELYSANAKIINGRNVRICDTATIRNGLWNSDLTANNWTCIEPCTVTGNMRGSIILNADLTINGDVELRGTIENNGYMLSVGGEFINYGVLVMENDKAHTLVNGRYYQSGTSNYLTAGIMEIKGDISGGYYRPTGTHRTILSGSSKQTVDALNGMDRSWFNILEITNMSEDGLLFLDSVNVLLDIIQPIGTKITNSSYVTLQNKSAFVDYGDLNSQINSCNGNAENVIPTWLDYERYCKFVLDGDKVFTLNEAITDTTFTCDLYFSNDYSKTSAVVIVAFYDGDNRFVQMASKPVDVKAGKIDCSIEFEDKDYSKCKVMIWESLENLIPLSSVFEF